MSRSFGILVLMSALACFTGNPLLAKQISPFSLPVGTVVIDAGHGGDDPGAVSSHADLLLEKDIALDIALRTARFLANETSCHVILTRDDDTFLPLADRAAVAARHDPGVGYKSIFLSIHVNSSTSEESDGFEVLVKKTSKRVLFLDPSVEDWVMLRYANNTTTELNHLLNRENLLLATLIHDGLSRQFGEVRPRGVKEQDVWVLNASKVPSALIEVAFISNPGEAASLSQPEWRERMARAIADGVLDYINRY